MKFNEFSETTQPKKKTVEPLIESIFLTEATIKVSSGESRDIRSFLTRPRSGEIQLKCYDTNVYPPDEQIITATKSGKTLELTFSNDFYEVATHIVDLCDDLGLEFEDSYERHTNTRIIEVFFK